MRFRCFVIIPYNEQTVRIYQSITQSVKSSSLKHEVDFIRADSNQIAWEIESNVRKHLELCDFAIADVSESNANVFFEVGYIVALNKPIILLNNKSRPLPTNLQSRYSLIYDKDNLEQLKGFLPGYIDAAINSILSPEIKSSFNVMAYNTSVSSDVNLALKHAKNRVYILTTNMSTIFSSGMSDEIEAHLSRANKISMRFLALDPESYFANIRAKQIGINIRSYREDLRRHIQKTQDIFDKNSATREVTVALYDEMPYQDLCIIDNLVFMSLLTSVSESRYNLTFRMNLNDPGVGMSTLASFDSIWGRSRRYYRTD